LHGALGLVECGCRRLARRGGCGECLQQVGHESKPGVGRRPFCCVDNAGAGYEQDGTSSGTKCLRRAPAAFARRMSFTILKWPRSHSAWTSGAMEKVRARDGPCARSRTCERQRSDHESHANCRRAQSPRRGRPDRFGLALSPRTLLEVGLPAF